MLVTINTVPQSPDPEFFKTSQFQSSPFAPVYQNLLRIRLISAALNVPLKLFINKWDFFTHPFI